LGQAARTLTFSSQYEIPGLQGLALTLNATHRSSRPADTRNLVELPARTIWDAGFRWQSRIGEVPTLLRVQMVNVTNAYDWQLVGSGSYQVNSPRQLTMFLTMDL
jgi:iron complex outermembrane receptor protein